MALPGISWPSPFAATCGVPLQGLFGYIGVCFPKSMPYPPPGSSFQGGFNGLLFSLLSEFFVGDTFGPKDTEYSPLTFIYEYLQLVDDSFV